MERETFYSHGVRLVPCGLTNYQLFSDKEIGWSKVIKGKTASAIIQADGEHNVPRVFMILTPIIGEDYARKLFPEVAKAHADAVSRNAMKKKLKDLNRKDKQ